MRVLEHHINFHLTEFIKLKDNVFFEQVFDLLKTPNKNKYKKLLVYIYNVLNIQLTKNNDGLDVLHFHFEFEFSEDEKTLLAEFLWHYYFRLKMIKDETAKENISLKNTIESLKEKTSSSLSLPSNNNKHEIKKIRQKRYQQIKHLEFYKNVDITASLMPKVLFNFKVNQENELSKYLKDNPTFINTEHIGELNSYVIYNALAFNKIKQLKIKEKLFFKKLENIILFDCENSLKRFQEFNYRNLKSFNENYGTKLKQLLLITFGKSESSLNALFDKTALIKNRFYVPQDHTYTVTNEEISYLLEIKQNTKYITPKFIGNNISSFILNLFHITKVYSLYELRSLKLMNYYSLCYSDELKQYILNQIFENPGIGIITEETKRDLEEIEKESLINLKTTISHLLDSIIESYKTGIMSFLKENNNIILLDDTVKQDKHFLDLLKNIIKPSSHLKFITWQDFQKYKKSNDILILNYRDQGNFYHQFYPNLIESKMDCENVESVLHAFLFKNNYDWALYKLQTEYFKTLAHPIRTEFFDWEKLKIKIESLRPEVSQNLDWGLESDYSYFDDREKFYLKLKNDSKKLFTGTHPIIYSKNGENNLNIINIRWLCENIDLSESDYKAQQLEELIDVFNPIEELTDTKQLEKELEIIKRKYNLAESEVGRLWKILLYRKSKKNGFDYVYNDLEVLFKKNGLALVSKNHFEKSWCNPDNDSLMPRSNKDFRVLCHFLNLSTDYRRIMFRIKNRTVSGKRKATITYRKLLKDLFKDGCFNKGMDLNSVLNERKDYYINEHNLEELGIDQANAVSELSTLIELLIPEIKLRIIESINKADL